jgi:hypothetical protein
LVTKEEVKEMKNKLSKECEHPNMRMTDGCIICPDCGFSKCD